MADKEFTQICKEILGIGKRLEKIEPDELREIKASIERVNEAFNASKALFDESKDDFDSKYNKVAQIVVTFDTLKAQIEEVLKSGTINDSTEALISTFSSKKIMDLLNEAKRAIDEKFSTIHKNGITPWSSTLEYPAGAISVLNGKLYQAKSENTNKNPSENKEIWSAFASKEWSEQTFLNKNDKIDAYSKTESDDKFAPITSLPELATKTKEGIVKLTNTTDGNAEDATVTQKAINEKLKEVIQESGGKVKIVDFGTVTINKRYVINNPFGNDKWASCVTIPQLQHNGKWFQTGWFYSGSGYYSTGVISGSMSEGIVVQTGGSFVSDGSVYEGNLYGGTGIEPRLASAKCRVLVFYIGELQQ